MSDAHDTGELARTALLLLDLHRSTIERYQAFDPNLLSVAKRCLDAARAAGLQVVYVVGNFRPGFPEISPRNEQLWNFLQSGAMAKAQEGKEIHPELAPLESELVVVKKRVGAFVGSDLDLLLSSQGIERLVVGGVATSGVVLSTVRAAADLDYRITVLADCCTDPEPDVHRILTERVFTMSGSVTTSQEWIASLTARAGAPGPSAG
jgi:nicotinamidase-related amidase